MKLYLQQLALVLTLFSIVMAGILLSGFALALGGLAVIELQFTP
jgi:hypothetical protein